MKICIECGKNLPLSEFYLNGKKGGIQRYKERCRDCHKAYKKQRTSSLKKDVILEENEYDLLVQALLTISRGDIDRLEHITEEEFIRKSNSCELTKKHGYKNIFYTVYKKLHEMGLHHDKELILGAGRYLVVGDSHGKHTKTKMFSLIKNLNKNLKFDQIIHIGHLLDDDNTISYCWKEFDNLTVLTKQEELSIIERSLKEYKFNVIRDEISLGMLKICNQDMVSDYVKNGLSSIDNYLANHESVIVNLHKQELQSRSSYKKIISIASPGCICEKHIVKTIKQIDFTSGYQIKEARPEAFSKYRRMKHMYEYWEQGMIVVEVDKNGKYTIYPCRIKKIDNEYVTSVYDKIYTESKTLTPDNKIFINSDIHCDNHDVKVLNIQEQIVNKYKPNVYINLGDMQNNKSLNHHDIDKHNVVDKSFIEEMGAVNYVFKKTSKWANEKYFFYGNHERFAVDFYKKYPQLKELLSVAMKSPVEQYNFVPIKYKDVLHMGDVKFIHGDYKLFGASGSNVLNKLSNTFKDIVIGHMHFSGIKQGVYVIGLTGNLDQDYNEVKASNWVHGFGICNIYKGISFVNPVSINNYKVHWDNNTYVVDNKNNWSTPTFKIKIDYEFE